MTSRAITPPSERTAGHLYFIAPVSLEAVKIGSTKIGVKNRVRALQTAHYEELLILHTQRIDDDVLEAEQRCHLHFAEHRLRGEWFEAEPVLDYLEFAAEGFEFSKHRYPYTGFSNAEGGTYKRVLEDAYRKLTICENQLSSAESRLDSAAQEIVWLHQQLTPWISRDEVELLRAKWRMYGGKNLRVDVRSERTWL